MVARLSFEQAGAMKSSTSPKLRRRAGRGADAEADEVRPAAPVPPTETADASDAPRCPLGFTGALPAWHAPVPQSAVAGGARCPFGFGASAAPAPATSAEGADAKDDDREYKRENSRPWLLQAHQLPAWMRDNDYIRGHYRPQMRSVVSCAKSGFLWLTNETVNVWTHFVAFLFFLYLALRLCGNTGLWSALHLPSQLPERLAQHLRHLPDFKDIPHAAAAAAVAKLDAAKQIPHAAAAAAAARLDAAKHLPHAAAAAAAARLDAAKHLPHAAAAAAAARLDAAKLLPSAAAAAAVARLDAAKHLPHAAAAAAAARLDSAKLSALSGLLRARGFAALRRDEARAVLRALGATAADVARAAGPLLAEHRAGMLPLLVTAAFCTAASTLYHVFWVYSPRAYRVFGKLDFVGIALLCVGHGVSAIFYAFFCKPELATRYYVAIAVVFAACIAAIFTPRFQDPAFRTYRTIIFSLLGASSAVPFAHAGYSHSWYQDNFSNSVPWMVATIVAYGSGAFIYASRYPERCRPGKHDKFWSSHQLMHLLVIAGGSCHAYHCHSLMNYRLDHGCAASPFLLT